MISREFLPVILTIDIAPRPSGVDIAQIVSFITQIIQKYKSKINLFVLYLLYIVEFNSKTSIFVSMIRTARTIPHFQRGTTLAYCYTSFKYHSILELEPSKAWRI